MSTPYRPETSGITIVAVRRAKEDTSALMVQSGLSEGSWSHVIHPTKEHSKHHLMGQSFLFGAILLPSDHPNRQTSSTSILGLKYCRGSSFYTPCRQEVPVLETCTAQEAIWFEIVVKQCDFQREHFVFVSFPASFDHDQV